MLGSHGSPLHLDSKQNHTKGRRPPGRPPETRMDRIHGVQQQHSGGNKSPNKQREPTQYTATHGDGSGRPSDEQQTLRFSRTSRIGEPFYLLPLLSGGPSLGPTDAATLQPRNVGLGRVGGSEPPYGGATLDFWDPTDDDLPAAITLYISTQSRTRPNIYI